MRHSLYHIQKYFVKVVTLLCKAKPNPSIFESLVEKKLLKYLFDLIQFTEENKLGPDQGRTQEGAQGARAPLNGNHLNTNLLLTFVKTQNNSAHAYSAI